MVSPACAQRRSTRPGPASSRCSRLSRISSIVRRSRNVFSSVAAVSSDAVMPSARAIVTGTRSGSRTAASGTKPTVSKPTVSNAAATFDATSSARRVFPTPPGPVRVTRRAAPPWSSACSPADSRLRPTRRVNGTGLGPAHCGRRVAQPATPSWSGRSRSGVAAIRTRPPDAVRVQRSTVSNSEGAATGPARPVGVRTVNTIARCRRVVLPGWGSRFASGCVHRDRTAR